MPEKHHKPVRFNYQSWWVLFNAVEAGRSVVPESDGLRLDELERDGDIIMKPCYINV